MVLSTDWFSALSTYTVWPFANFLTDVKQFGPADWLFVLCSYPNDGAISVHAAVYSAAGLDLLLSEHFTTDIQ